MAWIASRTMQDHDLHGQAAAYTGDRGSTVAVLPSDVTFMAEPGSDIESVAATERAIALADAYKHTGKRELLDEAVALFRAATAATPTNAPAYANRLNNLGIALRTLFDRTDDLNALYEAVQAARDAVDATPAGHPDRAGRADRASTQAV
jgi:Tetratricopeptide repeat